MAASNLIILTVLACALFVQSDALTCQSCSSVIGCNDAFSTGATGVTSITTLIGNACTYCSKAKTLSYGSHYVSRSCISSTTSTTYKTGCFKQFQASSGDYEIRCYCDTDDCNSGRMVAVPITLLMAMLAIYKMIL